MDTVKNQFVSSRPDGRFTSSMAAHMEMLRREKPKLSLPENLTKENFPQWNAAVREKLRELLLLPEFTPQPSPVLLSSVQREGYRVDKWEFYPDDYTAASFLALIPDGADEHHPVPGVLCFPGSIFSKESLAGEPLSENPMSQFNKFPQRNCMALHMVKAGYAAFAFDHPETADAALVRKEDYYSSRTQMCHGYIQSGLCYPGVTVFQKLCVMEFIKALPYVDASRLAVSGHSLGTECALYHALLSDDIKAVVFNDMLSDQRQRYVAVTEYENLAQMRQNIGNWHEVPGLLRWFAFPDLCAALAPTPIAFNEGGAEEWFRKVLRAYALFDAEESVQISHYPKFADPASRTHSEVPPEIGLSEEDYFALHYTDPGDHSFRAEPSLRFLKNHL
ncbi:MAG: acetylxylan esterase [Oscillospiraceae bacterium]|nr:acetylxylan esterase [Oscillospiraceae bacterium]